MAEELTTKEWLEAGLADVDAKIAEVEATKQTYLASAAAATKRLQKDRSELVLLVAAQP